MPLNSTDYEMAAMIFGNANIKRNLSNVLSPMPMGLFCKDNRNERFQGEKLMGFLTVSAQPSILFKMMLAFALPRVLMSKK